jgi:hypothetical protein
MIAKSPLKVLIFACFLLYYLSWLAFQRWWIKPGLRQHIF